MELRSSPSGAYMIFKLTYCKGKKAYLVVQKQIFLFLEHYKYMTCD
jgi:hypothetical protein